ncbi:DUF1963 domain-containing protein [Dactylosporangium sp. NPDC006015]|uniref:DUF1963 domain-containing protein n=1 Tax=Dactylosporangium sp. NPDC006015 TaxID=3154576 RepID=UPI0033AEF731
MSTRRAGRDAELDPSIVAAVLALARPALELAVLEDWEHEDDEIADGGRYAGSYGGLPRLPPGVDWPAVGGEPLTLLAQLRCDALAGLLGAEWTLPRDGLLLFFAAVWRDEPDAGRVLHVPDAAPVQQAPEHAEVVPAQPLGAWPVRSVPELDDPALRTLLHATGPALIDVLRALAPEHTPHQVLGRLGDGYHPPRPGTRPLLQLEGEEGTAWGELVRLAFVVPDDDLRQGRLDRVRMTYEVA